MPSAIQRVKAFLLAVTTADWRAEAGKRVKSTLGDIDRFTEQHGISGNDLVEHGSSALRGAASERLAKATRDFAEAEEVRVKTALALRTLEANARKAEAEADIAELSAKKAEHDVALSGLGAVNARIDLLLKLKALGVTVSWNLSGELVVLNAPEGMDLMNIDRESIDSDQLQSDVTDALLNRPNAVSQMSPTYDVDVYATHLQASPDSKSRA